MTSSSPAGARLVLLTGSMAGSVFEIPDTEALIGRGPHCHLRFDGSEDVVSTVHARIQVKGPLVLLRDEHSRNGTFVDGQPITACELKHGQTVMFGSTGPKARVEIALMNPVSTRPVGPPVVAQGPAPIPIPPPMPGVPSGLTGLYQIARERATVAGEAAPSQTAIIKSFVRLAQERSSRRSAWTIGTLAVAGMIALIVVFVRGERKAEDLRGQLALVTQNLASEGQARAAVETQLARLVGGTAQGTANISTPQTADQRRDDDRRRQGVEDDARFGPTVTQRYSAGVGLLELKVGWHSTAAGWLRVRGSSDGQLSFATNEGEYVLHSSATCTGFLIDAAGWVVTNRHCVDYAFGHEPETLRFGTTEFRPAILEWRIAFPPGRTIKVDARSVQFSTEHDLGLFRLAEKPTGIPVIPLARDVPVVAGEDVVLLSYPGGVDVTAVRSGVAQRLLDEAAKVAVDSFTKRASVDPYIDKLPDDEKQIERMLQEDVQLQLLNRTIGTVSAAAEFDALVKAGQLQPDVSGRMNVSGVRADAISYHALGGVAGSSGGPLIGLKLAVVGVNFSGFGKQINGKQYQQSDAVPVSYVLRLLPAGVAK